MRPDKAFFLMYKSEENFGNLCMYRGSTVKFCRSAGFSLRKSLEDEVLPWAFTLEGDFGALDSPGLVITGVDSCVP